MDFNQEAYQRAVSVYQQFTRGRGMKRKAEFIKLVQEEIRDAKAQDWVELDVLQQRIANRALKQRPVLTVGRLRQLVKALRAAVFGKGVHYDGEERRSDRKFMDYARRARISEEMLLKYVLTGEDDAWAGR